MAIEVQQASRLGAFYQTLELKPKDRIAITRFDASGQLEIWDLETGRYFTVRIVPQPPTIYEELREVPEWLKGIFNMSSDDLITEYQATWEDGEELKQHSHIRWPPRFKECANREKDYTMRTQRKVPRRELLLCCRVPQQAISEQFTLNLRNGMQRAHALCPGGPLLKRASSRP